MKHCNLFFFKVSDAFFILIKEFLLNLNAQFLITTNELVHLIM